MIVEGKSGKVDNYKFTAIVFTGLYIIFELIALFNNTAGNEEYADWMKNVILFQQVGVGICVVVYDIIAFHKWFQFKKHDKLAYFIHPVVEKILEVICLVCGVIGFGVACFY
ncbi:hypothetical protein [Konateibacter massiliensis]|uniref:hypothetical protein n=1 Tax=Konateibacter massiliensis TaxID=2002841 RepID=UPI000C15CFD7|nr:hypothetical protein [Konateibacter massiliensis]